MEGTVVGGEAGDTWKGGQDGVDAVSLWSGRNFRKFTDKGLYFLPEILHSMRAREWVGTKGERWQEKELTKAGLGAGLRACWEGRQCICSGAAQGGKFTSALVISSQWPLRLLGSLPDNFP